MLPLHILEGIGIDDESFVGVGISAKNGIQDGCFDFCKGCSLLLPPDEWYILFCKLCDGLKNFGTIENVILDKINYAKESSDLFDAVRHCEF